MKRPTTTSLYKSSLFLLVIGAALLHPADCIKIELSTEKCGVNSFTNLEYTATCNDESIETCVFGDTVLIEGSILAIANFTPSDELYTASCMFQNYWCPEENIESLSTICNWMQPVDDNQTCGEVGYYTLSGQVTIPESDVSNWFIKYLSINVGVVENECDDYTDSGSYQMSYSLLGALFLLAFGSSTAIKRYQKIEDDDDEKDDDHSFVKMKDTTYVVV